MVTVILLLKINTTQVLVVVLQHVGAIECVRGTVWQKMWNFGSDPNRGAFTGSGSTTAFMEPSWCLKQPSCVLSPPRNGPFGWLQKQLIPMLTLIYCERKTLTDKFK